MYTLRQREKKRKVVAKVEKRWAHMRIGAAV